MIMLDVGLLKIALVTNIHVPRHGRVLLRRNERLGCGEGQKGQCDLIQGMHTVSSNSVEHTRIDMTSRVHVYSEVVSGREKEEELWIGAINSRTYRCPLDPDRHKLDLHLLGSKAIALNHTPPGV